MNEQENNLTPGRIMHFVLDHKTRNPGECRPAIVVRDFGGSNPLASLNMVVFMDGGNDTMQYENDGPLIRWETSVIAAHDVKVKRSWHWPRECSHLQPAAETIIDGKLLDHPHAVGMVDINNCWACKQAVVNE